MLIRCEMLKKLANAFIEVAKEENPVSYTHLTLPTISHV